MNIEKLVKELVKANYHKGGIKVLKLFKIRNDFFNTMKEEMVHLIQKFEPSSVSSEEHISYEATKPFGNAVQYSLLNASGRLNDPSLDYDRSNSGKKFHLSNLYPNVASFIDAFPYATNMKILGLGPNSGLSPHEAEILRTSSKGYSLEVRCHLPIITNERAEMFLDDELYRFQTGLIYLFNQGCVHSASNFGDKFRYHLVWDMPLTKSSFNLMFPSANELLPPFLEKISEEYQNIEPHATKKIDKFEVQDLAKEVYDVLNIVESGVEPHIFKGWLNEFLYLQFKDCRLIDLLQEV